MKILSFGGINIDYVYHLDRFVREGESIPCDRLELILGGKGCNQSIAVAHNGLEVFHAGKVGTKDLWLLDDMIGYHVDVSLVKKVDAPSGHAIIQMDKHGKNSIILYGGANHMLTEEEVKEAFSGFGKGDFLLTQNELNMTDKIIEQGHRRGMEIFINATPINDKIHKCHLEYVDHVIVNEVEGELLTGETELKKILRGMRVKCPQATVVITLGSAGLLALDRDDNEHQIPAPKVKVAATTSAGDTFTGYFTAGLATNQSVRGSLELACKAAALCVTRKGTTNSIPRIDEVNSWRPEYPAPL